MDDRREVIGHEKNFAQPKDAGGVFLDCRFGDCQADANTLCARLGCEMGAPACCPHLLSGVCICGNFGSSIQLYVMHSSYTGSLFLDWPYFVSHTLWLACNLQFIPLPNQQALALRLALNRPDLLVTVKAG